MCPSEPPDDLTEQIREDEHADRLRRMREIESTIETGNPTDA